MENCGSAVIKCDQIFTWPSDQPRHATYASAYPVETNSPPVEAYEGFPHHFSIPDGGQSHNLLKGVAVDLDQFDPR
jgi:hypothetical protein